MEPIILIIFFIISIILILISIFLILNINKGYKKYNDNEIQPKFKEKELEFFDLRKSIPIGSVVKVTLPESEKMIYATIFSYIKYSETDIKVAVNGIIEPFCGEFPIDTNRIEELTNDDIIDIIKNK